MVRLLLDDLVERWAGCPTDGKVVGVYICPEYLIHGFDQICLGFKLEKLNRNGQKVFGWHIRRVFEEDVREKRRIYCTKARRRRELKRNQANHYLQGKRYITQDMV